MGWSISARVLAQLRPVLHKSISDKCNAGFNCANKSSDIFQSIL